MTQVKVVDRKLLKVLRDEINEALAPIAHKYGIALAAGNASFTPNMFHYKLEGVIPDSEGGIVSVRDIKAVEDYKRMCGAYGLKQEWRGREFQYGGRRVKLIGLMPRRTRFPLLVEDLDSHVNKLLPYEPVKAILGRSA